ncbi:glycoprotein 3-alpha-L-fucosyltransferase A [Octopus bimaculoides]|uniref:Fucosyltransferase n=1 Tax=Octopus bimaculoides TaxID=37653 RepID=A0A0L8FLB7_OCTBM|nr:glycoprotein 3-alpha-L-fucosyltransferase A [Octopus bimaculoides]|eukprot:XP_014788844.1 PREDICTED: glycoprotein 3-alpha-L-fucosyltransferase A-like [Octopus bimaculoides]
MRVQRTIISFCLFIITVNILLYKYNYQFEYYHKNPENLGNGTLLTRQSVSYNAALLFPINKRDVRIEAQLKYVLPTEKTRKNDKWKKTKQSQSDADGKLKPLRQQYKKLLIDNLSWLKPLKKNQGSFLEYKCPVNTCLVTYNKSEEKSVDAIFFIERVRLSRKLVHRNQIWMFMTHECPVFSPPIKHLSNSINWTITYRPDSTIAYPYSRFRYFNSLITQKEQVRNYAMGKPKKVAWFVSNCYPNNNRTDYAKELAKYIQVDIYGGCGTKVCKRKNEEQCFRKLEEEYKFYLAFENSNCRDYITEKFFRNALQ